MHPLAEGFTHIVEESELLTLLHAGAPLRVKAGFDPTAPDLHLGHAVLLNKLRQFQDQGHTVVMIVGDTTASIGDPTGRNSSRPPLTREAIEENASTYLSQAFKILLREKTVVRHNSDWFDGFSMQDMLKLMSTFTVSQMMARDDFKERQKNYVPIFMHELAYAMLQAYDSYREGVDIELGGNDQFYNLMMGREYMRMRGMKSQIIATTPLLVGTDGVEKMSKSKGNHIGLTEAPFEMFSKVMSISDATMEQWRVLLFPKKEGWHPEPFVAKIDLAWRIVFTYHNEQAANQAEAEWKRIFSNREKPTAIPVVTVANFDSISCRLDKLLAAAGMASSVSEAGRLVRAGAVTVDGIRISDPILDTPLQSGVEIKVGRKWTRISN